MATEAPATHECTCDLMAWCDGGGDCPSDWVDDARPWHCGLCGNDTEGCECGEPLVLVVRVPGLTPSETDHDLLAMSLVAMLNDERVENYDGEEGSGPAPIRLLGSGWREIETTPPSTDSKET